MANKNALPHGKASYSFAWNPSQSEWAETQRMIYDIWPRGCRSRRYQMGRIPGNYPTTGYYVKSPYPELAITHLINQISRIAHAMHSQEETQIASLGAQKLNRQWLRWAKEAAALFFSWDEATREAALILSEIGPAETP